MPVDFSPEHFLREVKNRWVSAGTLTILRQSTFELDDGLLVIRTTPFGKVKLDTPKERWSLKAQLEEVYETTFRLGFEIDDVKKRQSDDVKEVFG